MKKFRILIVDDDNNLALLLEARFKAADWDVSTANSAAEAYRRFFKFKPHLVLTDIGIGAKNGLDLITRIRRRSGNIPTIYMTGDLGRYQSALVAERKLHHAEVLEKPFRFNELMAIVSAQLHGQQQAA